MGLWDKKNREDPEESGKRSMLYSLWYRMKAMWEKEVSEPEAPAEGEGAAEAPSEDAPPPPPPTPFEKLVAPEDIMGYYLLYCQDLEQDASKVLIEDFCAHPLPEMSMMKQAFSQIDAKSKIAVKAHEKATKLALEKAGEYIADMITEESETLPEGVSIPKRQLPEGKITPAMDGQTLLFCTPNWSEAWGIVLPPLGGGRNVTEMEVLEALDSKGVSFGIDRSAVRSMLRPEGNFLLTRVAQSKPPVPGEDGRVEDHYSRTSGTPQLVENEQGIVDFGNLSWLIPIEEGTVICDIIEPTMGTPGVDIRGNPIRAYNGKKAVLPKGENVIPGPDGKTLVAKITGQISFRDGRFHVNNVIVIKGDVDLSTGSLNVQGDVVIHGSVLPGFSVKATGDVTIGGIVGGSQITAGGSIVVNRGMNGNLVGSLTAGKDIVCKYMENTSVHADGDIRMDSIVNCDVSTNGKVIATTGRGVIIGGTVRSMGGIEAKTIGNIAGRLTVLTIGPTPRFLEEKSQAEREREEIRQQLEQGTAKKNTAILQMKAKVLDKKLEQLEVREAASAQRQVVSSKLLPIVQVTIHNITKSIIDSYGTCRIYLDQKEAAIKIGGA